MHMRIRTCLTVAAVSVSWLLAPRHCAADWSGWLWQESCGSGSAMSPWDAGGWSGGHRCAGDCGPPRHGPHGGWPHSGCLGDSRSYAPTYRTTWEQVPVTRWEQVQLTDAILGDQFVSLQPCNTFEQQARRVPTSVWQRRPFASMDSTTACTL